MTKSREMNLDEIPAGETLIASTCAIICASRKPGNVDDATKARRMHTHSPSDELRRVEQILSISQIYCYALADASIVAERQIHAPSSTMLAL